MECVCPEKLSELGGLSKLSVPDLCDLYCMWLIWHKCQRALCSHELFIICRSTFMPNEPKSQRTLWESLMNEYQKGDGHSLSQVTV